MTTSSVEIARFADEHADAFERLNREWLVGHGLLEDGDLEYLLHPRETIVEPGGEVFVALLAGRVVGTCGVVPTGPETVEIVKLAVDESVRRRGVGRLLVEAAIEWSRDRSVRRITLVSSTKLTAALALYERLGFRHGPLPDDPGYETADVYMELAL